MAVTGAIILADFLEALLGKLHEVKRVAADLDAAVDGLRDTLLAISIIIDDAENRQDNNRVKLWMQRLREESYNARDVLDEVEYEARRRDRVIFQKVRNTSLSHLSVRRMNFGKTVSKKIEKIRNTLDKLLKDSSALNLRGANIGSRRPAQTSSETGAVGELNVSGRERDSNIILQNLIECSVASVDFISILGKAGLGKTTLAQVVFNDEKVDRHFHIKMWVHASCQDEGDIFGEKELIKATIQSITGETCNIPSLDIMQQHLRRLLEPKRYLLVLDGLLNDSPDFLHALENFLGRLGAYGSKVLITSRKRSIGKLISTIYTHDLQSISNNDCAQVIRSFAYSCSDRNSNTHDPDLDRIIWIIAEKCDGLPLAAKRYGLLLSVENEREKWELISRKEVAQVIDIDITQTLSSNVKSCFAYCSIFPRGYLFDKQQLIQLWLAQDIVRNEDEGSEYFDTMFRCSLFRHAPLDHPNTKQEYLMDDDIRSRAQLISGEECYHDNSHRLSETARHASLLLSTCGGSVPHLSQNSSSSSSHRNMPVDIESFYKAKGLYTLMLLAHPSNPAVSVQIPENLAKKLQRLRALDLSNTGLLELPSSVGDLKYLRYLALHNARIKRLPNSLCELHLLQTLGLRNCYELIKLPKGMRHLVNLRHLDLHLDDCSRRCEALTSMPRKIGKLTNLYTLSRFVVNKKKQRGLSQLRDMNNLHGSLTISGLEYVNLATDATDASLDKKEHLQMLELLWGEGKRDHAMDVELLERIRPNINIREIKIGGYRGDSLSSWTWDPSFSSLAVLKLYNCMNLSELPPLGQLRALKKLQLEGLPNWKSWSGRDERELTSLQDLVIIDCFNLYRLWPSLPSLLRLEIYRCPRILGLPIFPSLHSLKVKDSGDWILKSLSSLKSISSLSLEGMSSATLPTELQKCTSMHQLEIINFAELHFLSDDLLPLGLSHFKIEQCPMLQKLPLGLRLLEHLEVLQVRHCQGLLSLPPEMSSLRSLTYLELSDSPRLSFTLSDGLPTGLQNLIINNCWTLNQCLQQDWDDLRYRVPKVWIDGHLLVSEEAARSGASASKGNYNHS